MSKSTKLFCLFIAADLRTKVQQYTGMHEYHNENKHTYTNLQAPIDRLCSVKNMSAESSFRKTNLHTVTFMNYIYYKLNRKFEVNI
jgi:hypothetical protein